MMLNGPRPELMRLVLVIMECYLFENVLVVDDICLNALLSKILLESMISNISCVCSMWDVDFYMDSWLKMMDFLYVDYKMLKIGLQVPWRRSWVMFGNREREREKTKRLFKID